MRLSMLHRTRIAAALQDRGFAKELECPDCREMVMPSAWSMHRRSCTKKDAPPARER